MRRLSGMAGCPQPSEGVAGPARRRHHRGRATRGLLAGERSIARSKFSKRKERLLLLGPCGRAAAAGPPPRPPGGAAMLASKKALVFGGTSGIGLATAKALAAAQATVVCFSRDISKASAEQQPGMTCEPCDVRDRDSLSAVFARHAPFDILVSAATGGDRALGPFLEMDLDGFKNSFDKLWGYANVVRLGAPHLSHGGNIVLVSGSPAKRIKPGQIALGSVGAAVENFARGVAPELAAESTAYNT